MCHNNWKQNVLIHHRLLFRSFLTQHSMTLQQYYSSWVCTLTSLWMLERWFVTYGWSSFSTFLSSWPHRSPGWMAMTFMSIFTLIWYVDLYRNWQDATKTTSVRLLYQHVSNAQWFWLIFITGFTIIPGLAFVLIELFRETATAPTNNTASDNEGKQRDDESSHNNNSPRQNKRRRRSRHLVVDTKVVGPIVATKGDLENIVEGVCLLALMGAWIPSVVFATSPGGIASVVGNSYFFTWATSIFVTETTVWWIHDWRKNIHSALAKQTREYQQKQQQVLKKTNQIQQRAAAARMAAVQSNAESSDDELSDDLVVVDEIGEHKMEEGGRRQSVVDESENAEFLDAMEETKDDC